MIRSLRLVIVLFFTLVLLAAAAPTGTWRLVRESDGQTPKKGATVTLTFSGGTVSLKAVMPGETVTDSGTCTVSGNLITVRFNEMGFGCDRASFTLNGNQLTLPFKVLSEGAGSSVWSKGGSLSGFSGDGGGTGGTGTSGSSGSTEGSGSGGDTGGGSSGTGTNPGGFDPSNPAAGSKQLDAGKCPLEKLVGQWSGKAAGAEVRFRRQASFGGNAKFNVMTLTTKHGCEFFFYISKDGTISGEGIILYNLDVNLDGVDALAGAVKGLLGMMPFPSMTHAPATSGLAKGIMDAKGVTSPSYSYKMVGAPQQRSFKITGKVYKYGNEWKIRLESDGNYLAGKTPDNTLWVEYSVNLVTEKSKFPTWSPFLKSDSGNGTIRLAAGNQIYLAESVASGKQRDGVRIWHEYTFSWYARKIN